MFYSVLIDGLMLVVLIIYAFSGYRRGFIFLFYELVGTLVSFYLAFLGGKTVGHFVNSFVNFPTSLELAVGFGILWLVLQGLYSFLSFWLYSLTPKVVQESLINRAFGLIPSIAKAVVLVAILLTLLITLPIRGQLRPAILGSQFARPLITATQRIEQSFLRSYSQELNDTLGFLTTTPLTRKVNQEGESVPLNFTTSDVSPDPTSEARLLKLVNKERASQGLKLLVGSAPLRDVGRAHAVDMLMRGYFAHNTPDGVDPFARMEEAKIEFLTAGENLAFAPTVELAHLGLMNSPKHRDNILDPEFGHVGMAVIDAGVYGKMFVQEFTN